MLKYVPQAYCKTKTINIINTKQNLITKEKKIINKKRQEKNKKYIHTYIKLNKKINKLFLYKYLL